jgi:hypothetical protein
VTGLTVGMRLYSAVCESEVVVIRAGDGAVDLNCGGQPMTADASRLVGELRPQLTSETRLGKRYVDAPSGLEVLCARPGAGGLTVDGRALTIKAPQALPASD